MALRSFADGAVFAEVIGEGPPRVLALHGWGRRGTDFMRSLEGLGALAVDLPGFGASPPPSEVIGAEGYAEIVAPLLGEFDGPPVLVGHSFGGRVGVCLAARWPHRTGPLILTGVPLVRVRSQTRPSVGYRLARALNRAGIVSDESMERRRRRTGSADYRAATGVMRDILVKVIKETYEDQLAGLAADVLLLWGADDHEVPVEVAHRASRLVAGSRVEVVEGVGHHLPLEAPKRLHDAVEAFLS